jgi:hypothetical protein
MGAVILQNVMLALGSVFIILTHVGVRGCSESRLSLTNNNHRKQPLCRIMSVSEQSTFLRASRSVQPSFPFRMSPYPAFAKF